MNELFEELTKITCDGKVEVHIFKFTYTSTWTVVIQKKDSGVEVKISGGGPDLPTAVADALDKWNRITGGIKEFSGPLITHIPNDEIPF